MQRADPRVFARPFELQRGQSLTPHQLVDRLNDLGYSHRERAEEPGQFTVGRNTLVIIPREGDRTGEVVRVVFATRGKTAEPLGIERIEMPATKKTTNQVRLDAPLITALITTGRTKRRDMPLQVIPTKMVQAVLAIEDQRFYDHAGVDPIAILASLWEYVIGRRTQMRGGSTVTQQLVKNTFLTQRPFPDPQVPGMDHVGRARAPPDEGSGARALSERRLARPARVLRDPRRRGGGPPLLRQGHHQRVARRGGDDCRRHPIAVAPLAVQQCRARQGTAQRRPAIDGRCRVHQRGRGDANVEGAIADGGAGARIGGAVLRRLRQPGTAGQVQVARHRGRLHDARRAPATGRAGRHAGRAQPCRRAARPPAATRPGGAPCRRSAQR